MPSSSASDLQPVWLTGLRLQAEMSRSGCLTLGPALGPPTLCCLLVQVQQEQVTLQALWLHHCDPPVVLEPVWLEFQSLLHHLQLGDFEEGIQLPLGTWGDTGMSSLGSWWGLNEMLHLKVDAWAGTQWARHTHVLLLLLHKRGCNHTSDQPHSDVGPHPGSTLCQFRNVAALLASVVAFHDITRVKAASKEVHPRSGLCTPTPWAFRGPPPCCKGEHVKPCRLCKWAHAQPTGTETK